MTILEALILGQPVVSTNNTGAQEILQDDVTGVLCAINARSVADEVHALLEDVHVLESLRKNVAEIDMDAGNLQIIAMLDDLL